ncbi:EamA family transporter [Pseudomonas baltica]|uniref:EamA family transporter n=1 Tax=Pseudomonas baltica TaxID=2762576 RepID=UPI0028980B6C|nr:EamA family transporter [Pseudomonas baltica]
MTLTLFALIALTVSLDVVGQLAFKLGLDALPELAGGFRLLGFCRQLFAAPLLWTGILAYVVEFVTWLTVLSMAPLSLVFPAAALSYCGVVVAGRVVLKEHISRRRWMGTVLITAGVMLVCATQ